MEVIPYPKVDAYYTNGEFLVEVVEIQLISKRVRFRNSDSEDMFSISMDAFEKQYWMVHEPF
jgi:hypothetical protein